MNSNLFARKNILVACSGGADSMSLITLMYNKLKSDEIETLACAHFNHLLREDSELDERFVEEFCRERNIAFFCEREDIARIAKEKKQTIEQAARERRYEFLIRVAAEQNMTVATAHTIEDNAETVLFNLIRGAGGIKGIPPERGNIIRPIINVSREDVLKYLAEKGVGYREDSTNKQPVYTRNKLRLKVIPVLKEINPKLTESLMRASEISRTDEDFLTQTAKGYLCGNEIDINTLMSIHRAIASRVIILTAKQALPYVCVQAIFDLCASEAPNKQLNISKDLTVFRRYEKLIFSFGGESADKQPIVFTKECNKINKTFNSIWVNADTINGVIVWRNRRPGDKLKLGGCTKTVKKLMIEKKIPIGLRDELLVASDDNGVIYVESLGVHQDRIPKEGCEKTDIYTFLRKDAKM